jgi:hypothetical protein
VVASVAEDFQVATPAHEARIYDRGKSAISQYQWVCCREGEKRTGIALLAREASSFDALALQLGGTEAKRFCSPNLNAEEPGRAQSKGQEVIQPLD